MEKPTWVTVIGIIGVIAFLLSGFFVLSFTMFLMVKPNSLKLVYSALGLSIVFSVIRIIISASSRSLMGVGDLVGTGFVMMISLVLLIVIAVNAADYQKLFT